MAGIIILVILGAIVIAFIGIFNRFAHLRNEVKNAWAGIEVQLRRRHDLIPNLVETVKGVAAQEQEVFTAVADARSRLSGAIQTGDLGGGDL